MIYVFTNIWWEAKKTNFPTVENRISSLISLSFQFGKFNWGNSSTWFSFAAQSQLDGQELDSGKLTLYLPCAFLLLSLTHACSEQFLKLEENTYKFSFVVGICFIFQSVSKAHPIRRFSSHFFYITSDHLDG